MAFAALVSLIETLKQFLQPNESLVDSPNQELNSFKEKISSLKTTLEKIYPVTKNISDKVNDLETRTRHALYEAQDKIEAYIHGQADQSGSKQGSEDGSSRFLKELQDVELEIDKICAKAKEIADSIEKPKEDSYTLERLESQVRLKHRIVGQEEDFRILFEKLTRENRSLEVLPIHGMPGIGKTTLARSIYENSDIEKHFTVRAWVTVTTESRVVEIYSKLLKSIESVNHKSDASTNRFGEKKTEETEQELALKVYQSLFSNRYLIIVDDMWETKVWDKVKTCFPSYSNGSRVILTTRQVDIANHASSEFNHEMKPLNEENSWILLCDRAFKGGNAPPLLEDTGRKIAKNCKGLPLSLAVVGGQLSQEDKTLDYWKIVEEDVNAAAAKSEQPYKEILSISYNNLPARLKGCFLYMSAFPEDSEIPLSKLVKLWVSESFVTDESFVTQSTESKTLEDIAELYLKDLINRNLIMVRTLGSNREQIKSCSIHDVLRDLSVTESQVQKFFHYINRYIKELKDGVDTQRRLSIHKNILMCMEDVYNAAKVMTNVRTIVYAGQHHHHPMPFCLAFNLLKILDAYTVYYIEFPDELLNLIHLTYLSVTYNGQISSSISKLKKLQVLMVRQYPKIIFAGVSVLPQEIWNMRQLRHVLFTESELPELPKLLEGKTILFENLQTLSCVNIASCSKEVLKHMPNLKKLGMWTISPGEFGFHLDLLPKLEDFKFTVLCPLPGRKIEFQPELFFPNTITKMSLSGCGISWDEMSIVGELPKLEVLKLREFACQGEEWKPKDGEFGELKYLLLEALDLEVWDAENSNFPSLRCLIINHCYNLEEVPEDFIFIGGLTLIEMVDCGPTAVESLEKIRDEQEDTNKHLKIRIFSSWK